MFLQFDHFDVKWLGLQGEHEIILYFVLSIISFVWQEKWYKFLWNDIHTDSLLSKIHLTQNKDAPHAYNLFIKYI